MVTGYYYVFDPVFHIALALYTINKLKNMRFIHKLPGSSDHAKQVPETQHNQHIF